MADIEMKTGPAPVVKRILVPAAPLNRDHLLISVLFLSVAVAAAVGLGTGDWYTRQTSDYYGNYLTFYYGLTARVTCFSAAVPAPAGSTQSFQSGTFPCTNYKRQLYSTISLADFTQEERDAADHLIGAGDIIIVILSFAVASGLAAGLINLNYAYEFEQLADVKARHLRGAQILGFVAGICELLAIIFWITIFPYAYARDVELNPVGVGQGLNPYTNNPGFSSYLTLGVGFAIQIGGLFASFIALSVSRSGFLQPTSALPAANRS